MTDQIGKEEILKTFSRRIGVGAVIIDSMQHTYQNKKKNPNIIASLKCEYFCYIHLRTFCMRNKYLYFSLFYT